MKKNSPNDVMVQEFKSGLTWRSMLALLYSLFVFTPIAIWLDLVTVGVGLGGVIEYVTLLVFSELATVYGKPITKQEAVIIFGPATTAGSTAFIGLIYRAYFTRHPLLNQFGLDPNLIPRWWAPSSTSLVFYLRTFVHSDYTAPVLIIIITSITGLAHGIFFGLLGREIFVEGERLAFPLQHITVEAITVVATRPKKRMALFSWIGIVAFIYGIMLYTIPTYTSVAGFPVRTLPVPWTDYTNNIETYLPGGSFGVATDLIVLSSGIILPTPVILGIFIGSFARFLIINPLGVKLGWGFWAVRWTPGMNLTMILQDSTLYLWMNLLIGVGFAIGLVPIIFKAGTFVGSIKSAFRFKSEVRQSERISGPSISGFWMLLLFTVGVVGAIILDLTLVPAFPIWALILYELVFPFLTLLAAGRMFGETGTAVEFPYLNQLTILSSGYKGVDAWFLPMGLSPGTGWVRSFKICQLTGTEIGSWMKASLIAWPLAFITGFLYTSIFWQIAPIPSAMYPTPEITWPINIMHTCIWITRPQGLFDPLMITYVAVGFGALTALLQVVHAPFSMIGVATGINMPIPVATTILIGLLVKKVLSRVMGKEWIEGNKTTLAAGIALGEGIAIAIGVAFALAVKAIWIKAY